MAADQFKFLIVLFCLDFQTSLDLKMVYFFAYDP